VQVKNSLELSASSLLQGKDEGLRQDIIEVENFQSSHLVINFISPQLFKVITQNLSYRESTQIF
jgi:hypothetical protein